MAKARISSLKSEIEMAMAEWRPAVLLQTIRVEGREREREICGEWERERKREKVQIQERGVADCLWPSRFEIDLRTSLLDLYRSFHSREVDDEERSILERNDVSKGMDVLGGDVSDHDGGGVAIILYNKLQWWYGNGCVLRWLWKNLGMVVEMGILVRPLGKGAVGEMGSVGEWMVKSEVWEIKRFDPL